MDGGKVPDGKPLRLDGSARSASRDLPAFLARPADAPVYHGFPLVEETRTDGWCYGAITEFEEPDGCTEGDGFVVTPDGLRAGLMWSVGTFATEEVSPPEAGRWGVYAVAFPRPVRTKADLVECFRAVLPQLRAIHATVRGRALHPQLERIGAELADARHRAHDPRCIATSPIATPASRTIIVAEDASSAPMRCWPSRSGTGVWAAAIPCRRPPLWRCRFHGALRSWKPSASDPTTNRPMLPRDSASASRTGSWPWTMIATAIGGQVFRGEAAPALTAASPSPCPLPQRGRGIGGAPVRRGGRGGWRRPSARRRRRGRRSGPRRWPRR
jgi:hypothetical protein